MFATALAFSLALSAPGQDRITHQQAVECTGVLLYAAQITGQAAENSPSPETRNAAARAATMMTAADRDRKAAAAREGISAQATDLALEQWLAASVEMAEEEVGPLMRACVARYSPPA